MTPAEGNDEILTLTLTLLLPFVSHYFVVFLSSFLSSVFQPSCLFFIL